VRARAALAVVGVLVGAGATVLVTALLAAAEPAPATAPERSATAQLQVVHPVAQHQRDVLVRRQARAHARHERARERAHRRALRARTRHEIAHQRWVLPVTGYTLSAGFGDGGSYWASGEHTGQDFLVPYGTAVHAAHRGTVTFAGWGDRYGYLVEITHDSGMQTWYAHLSQVSVAVGQRVRTAAVVGATGCTGNCFGTHLHLEVRLGHDVPVDPLRWFALRNVRV
jgi:murein DD-endopeptidase MepM/ murein hydrolase activator NlpD